MKAVAYIRVSTEDQVQGTSLNSQEEACRKYAEHHGWTLHDKSIFRDEGASAKYADRPQLLAMVEFCRKNKGQISKCIVWKLDRFARNADDHMMLSAMLRRLGVTLCSVTEQIDDTASGRLMEVMLAGFAEFDNSVRTTRTTDGMKARTAEGGWPHDAPVGYKKARTPSGKSTIEPNEEAGIVKKFLEEFSTGAYTVKGAVELAFELGIRTKAGARRSWQSTRNILTNPLYMGYVCSKYTDSKLIKGLHPAIIDERTYYQNQAILNGSSKNFSRRAEAEWPLRGGFLKHVCGVAMTGSAPRGRSGPSPRYSCPKCRVGKSDNVVSKRKELVHEEFLELLQGVKPNAGVQRLFKEMVLRKWNHEYKDTLEHSQKLDHEINALKEKRSRILDLFIDGKLDENEKTAKLNEVDIAANKLELQRIDSRESVTEKEEVIDGALLFMSDPGLFWNQGSIEVKKRVQDIIFPEGLTYDCKVGFGTAKLSESYLLIREIALAGDSNNILVAPTGLEPVT